MANNKRISAITKELNDAGVEATNKDIIAFLEAQGIEGKKHSSAVDEDIEKLINDHFTGSKAEGGKKDAEATAKAEAKKPEEKTSAAAKPQNIQKPAEKAPVKQPAAAKPVAPRPQGQAPQGHAPAGEPPKKKKRIIFTVNNAGGNTGRAYGAGNMNTGRPQGSAGGYRQGGIIKPNVKPSPRPTVNIIKPGDQQNKKKFVHREESAGSGQGAARPAGAVDQTPQTPAAAGSVQTEGAGTGAESVAGAATDRRTTGSAYVRNNTQVQNVRPAGNAGDRNNRRPADNTNRFAGNGRPGAKAPAFGANRGFETAATPAPEKGGNRRKQNDVKRKKDDFERRDEEKENKKFNPHGFKKPAPVAKPQEEEIKVITISDTLTIKELADHMRMQPSVIIKKLFLSGQIVTVNSELSYEEAENIAADYDILCEQEKTVDVIAELLKEEPENEDKMEKRPPVVCVMGHVDHGKTSLLDYIRKAHVTDKEAGGITQAIGAYTVNIKGSTITFLDTPGHEAFTAMRMRGANATDIVILVVAADDGVMPQTVEAINHAKAAGVEIIVAVNKIDKPNANIDRVKQELSEYELISEDWGGSTTFVPVSAKTGQGIDELLEMILLEADVMELKANARRQARGMVIEAELDKGRGAVATVLVQKGTLHVGDFVACGMSHGRVRAMIDDKGKRVKEAGPSMPVEILGLDEVPEAGEIFVSPNTEKEAQEFANTYNEQHKKELLSETRKKSVSLDDIYSQIKEGDLKEFNIIIKADVQGSVEALKSSLLKLSNDEIAVKVIHGGVGAINESDVVLASASNAIIIGFNVRPDNTAKQIAESENVDIHLYKIIYQALEDVEAAMKGMLGPVYEERTIGHGEIRQVFKASGIGKIAGSYVTDGIVEKACSVKITRNGEELFDGPLASLKRFKDDVKEVKEGFECGLVFEGFDDVEEGDLLEFHKQFEVERT
ncbi:MAG: translation initiation factor IF-2 [Lachnospiraceae bacterium]|nr:translation initiation factor IF-2 [Lachnospiraceae bacterium]